MKLSQSLLGLALFGSTFPLASVNPEPTIEPSPPSQIDTSRMSVVVYDQMVRQVSGVPIRIERGTGGNGTPADLVTQKSGQSKTVTIPTHDPLIITLGETELKDGVALGVMHVVDGACPPAGAISHNQIYNLSMPHAATVELKSKQSEKPPLIQVGSQSSPVDYSEVITDSTDGAWPLWDISIPPYTGVFTSVTVASLINNWDITGRLLYGGATQVPASDYDTGLELFAHTETHLGDVGITLHISSPAYDFASQPFFDIVGFGSGNLSQMSADAIGWSHQTLAIQLSGTLPKGRILFLLRDSGNSQTIRFSESYSPPVIPITSSSYEDQDLAYITDGSAQRVATMSQENSPDESTAMSAFTMPVKTCACTPTEPGASLRTTPSPGAGLGFGKRVRNFMNGDCSPVLVSGPTNDVATIMVSAGGCGNVGSTNAEHLTTETTTSHKVPLKGEIVAPGGSNGGAGYEYEYTVTNSVATIKAHSFQGGDGNGECITYYEHHFKSIYVYNLMKDAKQMFQRNLGDGWIVWDERDVPCALPYKGVKVMSGQTATDTAQCPRTTVPDDQPCPEL